MNELRENQDRWDGGPASARWEGIVFDAMMSVVERTLLPGARSRLLAHAKGDVLEIAAGTGLNLAHYPAACRLTLTDHKPGMLGRAVLRARQQGRDINFESADAERLPFPDKTFDTVVATLALCEVSDPVAALSEMKRVCRSDGSILLLDHVRSHHGVIGLLQDGLNALTARFAGEHLNRDTLALARKAGLGVIETRTWRLGIMRSLLLSPTAGSAPAETQAACPG